MISIVLLAHFFKQGDRVVTRPNLALDQLRSINDLGHAPLDFLEVVGGERLVPGEIVVKSVIDRRADGDLRAGIEFLNGLGHSMGGVMADEGERVGVLTADETDGRTIRQLAIEIP